MHIDGEVTTFSAALCRGLIEAITGKCGWTAARSSFPRLYAAASLKQPAHGAGVAGASVRFPRLYAAASLKLAGRGRREDPHREFSAALCRGLIEARRQLR